MRQWDDREITSPMKSPASFGGPGGHHLHPQLSTVVGPEIFAHQLSIGPEISRRRAKQSDLAVLPTPGIIVSYREIIPMVGPRFQVSEI
jgi:hypothetical protein